MWNVRREDLAHERAVRLLIEREGRAASFGEVLDGWRTDSALRSLFDATLASVPYRAFRWEIPPITSRTTSRPFECVVLDSPGLDGGPDERAFAEHFRRSPGAAVVVFPNLGRDAILVVPAPVGPAVSYTHLARFVREAPESQRQAVWEAVGRAAADRLDARPLWINSAGAGVAWLHLRLDDRPKYYVHGPYRRSGGGT